MVKIEGKKRNEKRASSVIRLQNPSKIYTRKLYNSDWFVCSKYTAKKGKLKKHSNIYIKTGSKDW